MATGWPCCRLGTFLVFSSLFYLGEMVLHAWLLYHLYQPGQVVWFAACTGVVLLSLVTVQLLSFQLRVDRPKDVQSRRWLFVLAHVLLAGPVWRYWRLALASRLAVTRREVWELFAVRLLAVFTCTFPGLCVVTYLLFKDVADKKTDTDWALLACVIGYSMSVIWTLVTYQKLRHICCVVGALPPSGGGLVWKVPWRVAEVLARVLSIVLFSLPHTYWIVLVLALRWLTMSLLLVLDTTTGQSKAKSSPAKTATKLLLSSYIHIFVHFNTSRGKSRLVLTLYYVFTSAECVTLTVLWLLYDTTTGHHLALGTTVGVALVCSVLCTVGYYGCLHRTPRSHENESEDAVCYFQCITCRFEQLGRSGEPYSNAHITVQTNPNPPNFTEPLPPQKDQRSPAPTHRSSVAPTPSTRPRTKPPRHIRRAVERCRADDDSDTHSKPARDQRLEGELSWDDYDINTMSDSTATDFTTLPRDNYDQCMRDTFRELGIEDPEPSSSYMIRAHNVPVCKPSDYGYCSGISSSSSNRNNPGPSRSHSTALSQSLYASRSVPLFPNTCNGVWSDDASSTVTSLSSRVPVLGRQRTRPRLPQGPVPVFSDTTSLDSSMSYLSSTTLTSAYGGGSEPVLRAPPTRRHTTLGGQRRRPRPRPRKRAQRHYPPSRGHGPSTDTPSSIITESELGS